MYLNTTPASQSTSSPSGLAQGININSITPSSSEQQPSNKNPVPPSQRLRNVRKLVKNTRLKEAEFNVLVESMNSVENLNNVVQKEINNSSPDNFRELQECMKELGDKIAAHKKYIRYDMIIKYLEVSILAGAAIAIMLLAAVPSALACIATALVAALSSVVMFIRAEAHSRSSLHAQLFELGSEVLKIAQNIEEDKNNKGLTTIEVLLNGAPVLQISNI